jgi:formate hydrogenlyase subunit 6/NADH:ubiquinone oxidoreductase subunit I
MSSQLEERRLNQARRPGFGLGLLKGMAVTLKHLFKHNTVIEYPDEKQDLPPRTRGVIALKEENCTVCMLCGRECPDWCIYIDSHKETLPPKREGGRQRKRNVLDRFAIDYALCMYCGICVEVCPYDALFWSREFEYAEYDIRELTHEKERLSDWMATVLPPPELEEGADKPGAPSAPAAQTTVPAAGARAPTQTSSAVAARPAQAAAAPTSGTAAPTAARPKESEPGVDAQRGEDAAGPESPVRQQTSEARATQEAPSTPVEEREGRPSPDVEQEAAAETDAAVSAEPEQAQPPDAAPVAGVPNVEVPHEAPHPVALEPVDDPNAVYEQVLREQLDKGSSPQVAEARAKVARVKAERGIQRAPNATVREAPTPSPAVAPPEPAVAPPEPAEDPHAVYEQVLREQLDKGASRQVAEARANVARVKVERSGRREPTPVEVEKPVPSAPTKAEIAAGGAAPVPSGAPRAEQPQPEQGPVGPSEDEAGGDDSNGSPS